MNSADAGASRSLTAALLDFSLGVDTDAVPEDLLDWAVGRCVDTVGVALACASYGLGAAASRVVMSEPTAGPASVWASGGMRVSAEEAGFANGMLAHGMDYDDTHSSAHMHPGIVIVPTAIAVGEQVGASGREVLAATLIGYEVCARLGRLAAGSFQNRGVHPSSALGIFGAVAAAARLEGLDHALAVHAAGLAGSMASGLMEYLSDGSDTKQMHPGWAVKGAITAIKLARHGATGPATVLEGEFGVYRAFADQAVDPSAALTGLGEEWVGTAVATKPYPACHCVHAPVDALLALSQRLGIGPDDVSRIRWITALVPHWYVKLVGEPLEVKQAPRTVYEARFSLPYTLARAVADGKLSLESFEADKLDDPVVRELAGRIDYEEREYAEYPAAFPGGVRLELADGTIHEEHLHHNVGSVENPMTPSDLDAKFTGAARRVAPDAIGGDLLRALRELPRASSLADFTTAMAKMDARLLESDAAGSPA